jgi:hypothetical protein
MNISFLDFWGGFNTDVNFFTESLKVCKPNVNVTSPEKSDIIICSVFGESHKRFNKDKKIIFFTGENIRPTYNSYDFSLSFDFEDYDNRNIRLPLWYLYIDWFDIKTNGNPEYLIPESFLYNENIYSTNPKTKFCATVFSAFHPDRFEMMNKLRLYKSVDYYGKLGNPIPDGEHHKMNILSEYKFSICFENSIYPGYFTEKLLHAKISGTIPIYKSHPSVIQDFNSDCYINAYDKSINEIYDEIVEIDTNNNKYINMFNQPLFSKKVDMGDFLKKLNTFL